MRRVLRWPEKLMACGAATDSLLRVQAGSRSSGRHHQAKAQKGVARAAVLQAATAEAATPSGQAEIASNAKSQLSGRAKSSGSPASSRPREPVGSRRPPMA
jgi:hypothetical protein